MVIAVALVIWKYAEYAASDGHVWSELAAIATTHYGNDESGGSSVRTLESILAEKILKEIISIKRQTERNM